MKKIILPVAALIFLASCTKEQKTCTCKNWAKSGKIESTHSVSKPSDCKYYENQYNGVYGGDVICSLN
jgi:hypothetical protein